MQFTYSTTRATSVYKLVRRGGPSRIIHRIHMPESPACLSAIIFLLSKPSSLFQPASFSCHRRWHIDSSLWGAAIFLIRISLCAHSRVVANSACITVVPCSVKFVFIKLFSHQSSNEVSSKFTFISVELPGVASTPWPASLLDVGAGARTLLSALSTVFAQVLPLALSLELSESLGALLLSFL